ncbi:transcriptional regulator [Halomicroarcula sp. F13]|uniref:Transcriptional regulator n=2 Tax=Haloarcula TaxID=2237 RepID=A0A830GH48_9EURY|nr:MULTISPECIES: transcriptional regulator [Halomicroarcula]QIO22432.1 transcriptional regulator [Haloarcula sp. JP-L23]MBX0321648.1 transcriptional regulator [Halomicroarcula rubra]MBX0346959.1 transcriptional regulator [Halomicroarcula pellucida]MDS0277166.1 transcriptional regulator [Halomicroarcula sp. S1AR25-4]GGN86280.1 transcriptional regulator [Halomicroarcula pellucida]
MREASRTTRQRIADRLRDEAMAAGTIANTFEIQTSTALTHVEHIAKSLDATDEQLLVAPPECERCGFTDFDDLTNRPSRCPECKSESVAEPAYRIG